jgi:hypothetical protein
VHYASFFFCKGMYIWFLCMKEGQTASWTYFKVCRMLRAMFEVKKVATVVLSGSLAFDS